MESSRGRKSISPIPCQTITTTTTKILTSGNEDFKILGVRCFLPVGSPRRVQVYARIDPRQQRVGVPNLDSPSRSSSRGLWSSEPLEPLSLSILLSSLLGLMRRSWHLTDLNLPLWQLVWNIYGKLWIMGMEISRERIFWLAVLGLENSCDRCNLYIYIFFFLDGRLNIVNIFFLSLKRKMRNICIMAISCTRFER